MKLHRPYLMLWSSQMPFCGSVNYQPLGMPLAEKYVSFSNTYKRNMFVSLLLR